MRLSFQVSGKIFRQNIGRALAAAAILVAGATMSEAPHAQLFGPGPDNLEDCSRLKGYQLNACHAMNEAKRQQHRQEQMQQVPKKGTPTARKCPSSRLNKPGALACKISNNVAPGCRALAPKGWKKL